MYNELTFGRIVLDSDELMAALPKTCILNAPISRYASLLKATILKKKTKITIK